jgi:hypothetical protein
MAASDAWKQSSPNRRKPIHSLRRSIDPDVVTEVAIYEAYVSGKRRQSASVGKIRWPRHVRGLHAVAEAPAPNFGITPK